MINLIEKLTKAFGVSGNEQDVCDVITEEIKDYVDDIRKDALGNLIAVKRGTAKKIMLTAHMDEIGIIVTHIEDNGFLRFAMVGNVAYSKEISVRVRFRNDIIGVIYFEKKSNDNKNISSSRYFIDIGAKDKEDASKMVSVGDTASFVGDMLVQNGKIISKALGDRLGIAVLIDVIKNNVVTNNEVYYVFTAQEEVGARGAKVCAYDIDPDIAIIVDVTDTGDVLSDNNINISCGNGVAIKIKDKFIIVNPRIKNLLINIAKSNNIPYQLEVLEGNGTNAGSINTIKAGIVTGGVSIPTRYIHTTSEVADIRDVENAIKLLSKVLEEN